MRVEQLKNQILGLQNLIHFINRYVLLETDSIESVVFKKYLELENVKQVTEYINNLGYRVPTRSKQGVMERKYTPKDISNILKNKRAEVDPELKKFVLKLFLNRSRKAQRGW